MALGDTRRKARVKATLALAKGIKELVDQIPEIYKEYWSNADNTAIDQTFLDQFDVALADYTGLVTYLENQTNLMTGVAVTTADYNASLNKVYRAVI